MSIVVVTYFVVFHNLSEWEHVDVEQQWPQDGALGNSTGDFSSLRFIVTYSHKVVPVF